MVLAVNEYRADELITAAGLELVAAEVDEIVPNPTNPRVDLGDLAGLTDSIARVGVLQPLRVHPADLYVKLHPKHLRAVGDAKYVVQVGERRLAAAIASRRSVVPALVVPPTTDVHDFVAMMHENLQRRSMTPLEEARGMEILLELLGSRSAVADQLNLSRRTVTRRLALLLLPPAAQAALQAGRLSRSEADALAEQRPAIRDEAWTLVLDHGISATDAIQLLTTEPAPPSVLAPPAVTLGLDADAGETKKPSSAPSSPARPGNPSKVCPPPPAPHVPGPPAAEDEQTDQSAAELSGGARAAITAPLLPPQSHSEGPELARARASRARMAACAEMVRVPPQPGEAARSLVIALLGSGGINLDRCLRIVHSWLKDDIPSGRVDSQGTPLTDDPERWKAQILHSGRADHENWLGWAIGVAAAELQTQYLPWTRKVRDHLAELKLRVGYSPSPWEQQQLDAVSAPLVPPRGAPGTTPR